MDHFSDTLGRFQRWKQNLKSENIGGMAGMVGNLLVGCQLDPLSLGATAAFMTASGVFTAVGDKAWGYSTGAALVTAGCVMMACSPAAIANKALQTSLGIVAAAWSVGILRAPLHKIADHFEENRPKLAQALKSFAEFIPKGIGGVNLALRVPTAVAALTGQQWILLGAVASWGASDILLGNLQKTIGGLVDQAKQTPLIRHITERLHRRRGTKPASTPLPTSALDDPAQDPAFFSTEERNNEIPPPASDNGKRGNQKKPPGI